MFRLLFCAIAFVMVSASAHAVTVAPPKLPGPYSIPIFSNGPKITVSNSAQFIAAIAQPNKTVVLNDGTYSKNGNFTAACGVRIYAKNLGKAVLTSGLELPGGCNTGNVVRGLKIRITVTANGVSDYNEYNPDWTGAIWVWGKNAKLLDLDIDGGGVTGRGIMVRAANGLQVKRIVAKNFHAAAIEVDQGDWDTRLATKAILEDLTLSNVSRDVPKSADGQSEACLWIGNDAKVSRVKIRNCAWMGIWTGTSVKDSTFSDLDIDNVNNGIAIYVEHYTTNSVFQRMKVGPNIQLAAICEWSAPEWNFRPACDGVVFQDAEFNTTCTGVYLDDGTRNTTVRRTKFINQQKGAVALFQERVNVLYDTSGNDYSQMKPGAQVVFEENNPCVL